MPYQDTTIALGGTSLRLRGDSPLLELVLAELAPSQWSGEAEIDVHVRNRPLDDPPRGATALGPVAVAGGTAWCTFIGSGLAMKVTRGSSTGRVAIEVSVEPRPMPFGIPRAAFRWVEPTFMTPLEAQAYVFLLRVVEGALFLFGGPTALLHAACVEQDGRALAVTSAGGVGKTSIAARLLREPGWRYLADDILPITPEPEVSYYPRRVMAYAYNLRHDSGLRRQVVRGRGIAATIQWRALEALGVDRRRRRVPAADLYGAGRIGSEACLDAVALLTRNTVESLTIDDADPRDVARRCASIMANEQQLLGVVLRYWEAAGEPLVSFEEALERHRVVYDSAFRKVRRVVHVGLPASGTVDDAALALADIVDPTDSEPDGR